MVFRLPPRGEDSPGSFCAPDRAISVDRQARTARRICCVSGFARTKGGSTRACRTGRKCAGFAMDTGHQRFGFFAVGRVFCGISERETARTR